MSEATTSSSDQCLQYHYQHQTFDEFAVPHGGLSDSIAVSSSFPGGDTPINILDPENSCAAGNDLSPRASIGKPSRRRSRTLRRKPTTLLNASIKNFRTLVQQYTGFQSVDSSMKNQKGPINLSFGPSSEQNDFAATKSFGGRYYSGQPQIQEQNQQYHHQEHLQMYQGQQGLIASDENNGDFSAFSSPGTNMMTVDNFGWQ